MGIVYGREPGRVRSVNCLWPAPRMPRERAGALRGGVTPTSRVRSGVVDDEESVEHGDRGVVAVADGSEGGGESDVDQPCAFSQLTGAKTTMRFRRESESASGSDAASPNRDMPDHHPAHKRQPRHVLATFPTRPLAHQLGLIRATLSSECFR